MREIIKIFFTIIITLFVNNAIAAAAVCDPLCSSGQYCYDTGGITGTGCAVCSATGTPTELYPYSAAGSDEITDCYACETRVIANGTWPPDSPINYPTEPISCSYSTENIVCDSGYRAVADSNETYGYKCDNNYTITFNHQDTTDNETISITYGATLPNVNVLVYNPVLQLEIKSFFAGYYDATSGGTQYYDILGHPKVSTYNLTTDLTLYARWQVCTSSLPTYAHGYIHNFIINNQCRYYTACIAGYDNPYYDETLEHSSAGYSGDCDYCDSGYYCPSPTGTPHKPCPSGMTSTSNSTATAKTATDCFYQGGSSGTKFCDSNGCLHLPINIGY